MKDIANDIKNKIELKKTDEQQRLSEIIEILKKYELIKSGLTPEKLRLILEDLGPTFIKLGQVMSMRTDFLPKEYCRELEKLRTNVRELSFDEVKCAIEEEFSRPIDEIFEEFEKNPIGSASIAQVHLAVLKETGKKVVVKVQRPGIREIMTKDIHLMRKAVKMLKIIPISGSVDIVSVVDEMWTISQEELDFMVEASHIKEFYENNKYERDVSCPVIEDKFTNSKILVMEYIEGYSIGNIKKLDEDKIDRNALGTVLCENYMKQVLDDGFFHADPHPGNIRIRDGKIVWIDMGMMGRLSEKDRKLFRKAVKSVVKRDVNSLISVIMSMGMCKESINYSKLYEDIDTMLEKYCSMDMGDVDLAVFLDEMMVLMKAYKVTIPKGLSMLARGVMTIEGVIADVSPDVNIVDIAAKKITFETIEEFDIKKEIKNSVSSVIKSSSRMVELPSLMADLMETTVKGHTKVNLDLTGSEEIMKKLSKMVNKLIMGIIASSLLIGSSMLCTTEMKPEICGIPALGFIGFISAVVLAVCIIIDSKKNQ